MLKVTKEISNLDLIRRCKRIKKKWLYGKEDLEKRKKLIKKEKVLNNKFWVFFSLVIICKYVL